MVNGLINFIKKLIPHRFRNSNEDNVEFLSNIQSSGNNIEEKFINTSIATKKDKSNKDSLNFFDENLIDRVRTQWQFGDWETLVKLSREDIDYHPEKAKIALLVASGHQHLGNIKYAEKFSRLSYDWGLDKKIISKVLISGVINSIARAKMLSGKKEQARLNFEESISIVFPTVDVSLIAESRVVRELARLGLLTQAAGLVSERIAASSSPHNLDHARIKVLEAEIELLSHELSLAQQRGQIENLRHSVTDDLVPVFGVDHIEELKRKSVSQLGQDLWVLQRSKYKKDGFFVEFGATDGVLLSNTYLLEKEFGWKGICADPNPKFFEQLKVNRNCIVSNRCISGESGKIINFIFADAFGGDEVYSQEDSHKDKRDAYKVLGQTKLIETISLNDFLVDLGAPVNIDYLSIDTEGSEYEILQALSFDRWNIRFISVEHNYRARREDIQLLMKEKGYSLTEMKWDDWYEKVIY
jgi:FkbM family methyltransferase